MDMLETAGIITGLVFFAGVVKFIENYAHIMHHEFQKYKNFRHFNHA